MFSPKTIKIGNFTRDSRKIFVSNIQEYIAIDVQLVQLGANLGWFMVVNLQLKHITQLFYSTLSLRQNNFDN